MGLGFTLPPPSLLLSPLAPSGVEAGHLRRDDQGAAGEPGEGEGVNPLPPLLPLQEVEHHPGQRGLGRGLQPCLSPALQLHHIILASLLTCSQHQQLEGENPIILMFRRDLGSRNHHK